MVDQELDVVVGAKLIRGPRNVAHKLLARLGIAVCIVTLVFAIAGLHLVLVALLELLGIAMMSIGLDRREERWKLDVARRHVTIDATSVQVAGERPVALSAIRHAYLHADGDHAPTLRCENARGDVLLEARAASPEGTTALLEAVGGERKRRTWLAASPLAASSSRLWASLAAIPVLAWLAWSAGMTASGPMAALLAMFVAALAAAFPLAASSDAVIGTDGVAVRWLSLERFVPWSQVTSIEPAPRGARLVIEGARDLHIAPLGPGRQRSEAFVAQLRAAWSVWQGAAGPAKLSDRLARGGRSVTAWHADLRTLETSGAAYRATAVRTEDLWAVLTDAAEPEETRAAAAVALRARGEPERLRVTAEDIASPRLRVVLERAADRETDDAALTEALEDVTAAAGGDARARMAPP